jgi:fused signal recognition particle receptor
MLGALVTGGLAFRRARRRAPATPAAEPAPPAVPVAAAPAREPVAAAAPAVDLRRRLARTRDALVGRLDALLRGRTALDPALLAEVETLLFGADIGVRTADDLLAAARAASSPEDLRARLEARALEILSGVKARGAPEPGKPLVVLVVGVNGSGKTTTIAKLAARWKREGQGVLLAAADTFRAAAIDQLAVWAGRVGVDVVAGEPGGDPAAVAFDAVRAARARSLDAVIVDTAGRLQTQSGLMDELAKIARVVKKEVPGAPHEVLLVLDANTGQNAIRQAREFAHAAGVTSIVLTKLDGTAKGGVVLGIAQETGLPVRFVGVGEGLDDLVDFDPADFVRALFSTDGARG